MSYTAIYRGKGSDASESLLKVDGSSWIWKGKDWTLDNLQEGALRYH
jgi:hypothetical protein